MLIYLVLIVAQLDAGLMLNMINAQRIIRKLRPLKMSINLPKAAQRYAEYMAKTGIFSHTADGKSFSDRIRATGYPYPQSENIAMGYATTRSVTEGWFKSPGHMANLMNPRAQYIGFGYAVGKSSGNIPGKYWVQDIGG